MPAACVPARCVSTLLVHNLALSLLVLGYVFLGGVLFQRLESGHELKQRAVVRNFRDECLRELWTITERLNVLYERNWTHLVDAQLRKFEKSVVEATKKNGYDMRDSDLHWSFSGAVLYSVTVVTTIGYGNVTPRTAEGKVITMLYALVGVPLMLVCLSNLGTMLAQTFQSAYSRLCCATPIQKCTGNHRTTAPPRGEPRSTLVAVGSDTGRAVCSLTPEARQLLRKQHLNPQDRDSDDDDPDHTKGSRQHDTPSRVPLIWRAPGESRRAPTPPPRKTPPLRRYPPQRVPAAVVLVLLGGYLSLGALAFAAWEGWSLLDGAYFCFVTLSTIGFGDMIPGKSLQRDSQEGQLQTVACCTYLLLGLVIIAMSFSLLQEEVVSRGRHFANAVGLVKREDLSV
ncbi:potassium channel subfamily K member 15-like [Homalodisca vitripennis]|uniref:potassium channel subfamily K member 15-like n=1 Tax=Homalodisca vitripennis TaxID=197043 RepID=UPI001EECACD8|nr:potassium channel subfamily K member 15-like [Homalodisca vitripennis]KAG8320287.1 putative stabilization of membrane [Homalodisca vitripennis]